MFNLVKEGDPTFEAVTVAEIKAHARIYTSADDVYLDTLRVAAREQVEQDLEFPIVGQPYKLYLDSWPTCITLPIQPVVSIESIEYTDDHGDLQTLDRDQYTLRTYKDPPEIVFVSDITFPTINTDSEIVVKFTAGFDTETPKLIKHAILFLSAHWYEHRESSIDSLIREVPQSYDRVISKLRVKRFR